MGSPMGENIEELLGDYREQLRKATELTRSLQQISGTATSQRRTLKASVGSQGELTELEFIGDSYRELPPRELAALIMKTVAEARQEVMKQVTSMVAPTLPPGLDPEKLLGGKIDPAEILGDEPQATGLADHYIKYGRPGAGERSGERA